MVDEELQNLDPFIDTSILSLLPKTLGFLPNGMALDQQGSDPVQNLLRSMLPSQVVDRAAIANGEDQTRRRRPALGLQRAQFSFKPSQSISTSQADQSLNIDHLQDPDEFFTFFEMREMAEKVVKKLRGDNSTEQIQHNKSLAARPRRPGILGKKASYKHLYPPPADNMENPVSSQENFQVKIPTPSKVPSDMVLEATDGLGSSKEKENNGGELFTISQGKGSVAEENKIGSFFDELLHTHRDLDGDEMVTLLQENLNIKPLTLNKLSFPDLGSVQTNDLKASQKSRSRKALSVLQHSTKSIINRKTPVKDQQRVESNRFSKTSPTPPRSPFALMPSLQRRNSQLDPIRDPFSMPLDIDMSPVEHSSVVEGVEHNLSPPIDTDQTNGRITSEKIDVERSSFVGDLQDPMLGVDKTVGNDINSVNPVTEELACPFGKPISDNSSRFDSDMDVTSIGLDRSFQEKFKDMVPEASVYQEPDLNLESPTIQTVHCSGSHSDHPSPTAITCTVMRGHSENSSILSEQNNKELQAPASILPNRRRKQKTAPNRGSKKEARQHRHSLAGAGTSWKSGVRRSNRIKTRPLEYWRGERYLYGRIHDSLPTVIGLKKYSSPGSTEPGLKVKSYVDEKYAELLEIAAWH
ncbi:centromere protein C-like isoform X2 [Tasmannia lanceolata]|uniref:centromere protein C-like isoform X2 n=1 Tax=Tasmannia lanceolata TaxID=3420 RepID=UPI00406444A6